MYRSGYGINSLTYSDNWSVDSATFTAMNEGLNYASIKVFDNASNNSLLSDVFYIRKDTTPPVDVSLNSPVDLSARKILSPVFDWTDSSDLISAISAYDIQISTHEDMNTILVSSVVATSEYTAGLTLQTTHYWRARAKDSAGNYSNYTSTFSVIIDTSAPQITDNQDGEFKWRDMDAGAIYDVDFADNFTGIDSIEYAAYSGAGKTDYNRR
jgi:hypothetical protein